MEIKEKILQFYENHKKNIWVITGCLLIFSFSLIMVYSFKKPNKKSDNNMITLNDVEKKESFSKEVGMKISVDIKGSVVNPGVYEMDSNSRVNDVIEAAGGLRKDANTEYINLSKKLFDEMVIIIYSNREVMEFKEALENEKACICENTINDACIADENISNPNKTVSEKKSELVNINTATLNELMTLSGIGEAKAKAIIDYREKEGKFNSKEDIMKVSGIGESIYSKIKDLIITE